jgi:hypothetical protein
MQEELRNLAKATGRTFGEVVELWGQAKKEVKAQGKREGSNLHTSKAKKRLYELAQAPKAEAPAAKPVVAPKADEAKKED